MAWSDQCKVAFEMTVIAKKNMGEKRKSEAQVLRDVASETDIPISTLKRWWIEAKKKRFKNEPAEETAENDTEKEQDKQDARPSFCRNCGLNPVHLRYDNGRPYGRGSKYYGLCTACFVSLQRYIAKNKTATAENGIRVFCPKCGHMHYILDPNKEIKNADLQQERHSEPEEEGQLVHGENA